ncbi:coiled-coil-helix-coiled-coil-helix domain-containing protein 5 isoform X2 [Emydura macquarii macquarii]|uniref:coiled-coil-helix-coiled-coil-helix domain-containing protein 5 isoform X2 n=1 Tax=Emydura macquarii macquarii TaxID=1129001 RepID=UPI003529DBE5
MRVGRPGPARRRVCCFRVAARARPRDRPRGSMPPWRWRRGTAAARRSSTGAAWPPAPAPGSATVTSSSSAWRAAPPPSECGRPRARLPVPGRSSPIVQKIRRDCAEPFTAFEQCLKQNEASVMNCTEHVEQFLLCAEQVKLVTKGDTENFRLQE